MNLQELLPSLLQLSHQDKLRAIKLLASELLIEEGSGLDPDAHYEVWSPFDSAETARQLRAVIDEDARTQNE